ncbi:PE family protein, partial [Mycobacterium shinjukuense]
MTRRSVAAPRRGHRVLTRCQMSFVVTIPEALAAA